MMSCARGVCCFALLYLLHARVPSLSLSFSTNHFYRSFFLVTLALITLTPAAAQQFIQPPALLADAGRRRMSIHRCPRLVCIPIPSQARLQGRLHARTQGRGRAAAAAAGSAGRLVRAPAVRDTRGSDGVRDRGRAGARRHAATAGGGCPPRADPAQRHRGRQAFPGEAPAHAPGGRVQGGRRGERHCPAAAGRRQGYRPRLAVRQGRRCTRRHDRPGGRAAAAKEGSPRRDARERGAREPAVRARAAAGGKGGGGGAGGRDIVEELDDEAV